MRAIEGGFTERFAQTFPFLSRPLSVHDRELRSPCWALSRFLFEKHNLSFFKNGFKVYLLIASPQIIL